MVIVETSVWIDYFADKSTPQTEWLERNLDLRRLALTDLILCEVLQGFRSDAEFRSVQRELIAFTVYQNCSEALAIVAAENYRVLRRKGFTVRKTIDCMIATFCLEFGHELLHRDRDFDAFERHLGLRVVSPRSTVFQ